IQYKLFPFLEDEQGPLFPQHKKLISILELIKIEPYLPDLRGYVGRPRKQRAALARSFVAKIILKLPFTVQLIIR
ncbi:MAG: IS5/IS1182 family transposase, partial [Candidatus Saccharimonadales bacterium]